MLEEYVRQTMERKGFTVDDVPFFEENIFIAYKTFQFTLTKKVRPVNLQLCFFLDNTEVEGPWRFSQDKKIILPPFNIVRPGKTGLMKAVTSTLARAVREVLTEIPVITTIEGDSRVILKEADNVVHASEIVPDEMEGLDLYVEIPAVVTTAQLILTPKCGTTRTVGAAVVNHKDEKTEKLVPVFIINYQHLASLISNMGKELSRRLVP